MAAAPNSPRDRSPSGTPRLRDEISDILRTLARQCGVACLSGFKALSAAIRPFVTYLTRRWWKLDRKWQVWTVCAVLAALLLPLIFAFGGRTSETGTLSQADDGTSSPQAAAETVPKPESQTKAQPSQRSGKQPVPRDWVMIVNRKTGWFMWFNHPKRIEAVGDYYKIRCQHSGQCLALEDWG